MKIDGQKLLEYIKAGSLNSRGKYDLSGYYLKASHLVELIESGTFDIKEEEAPQLKVGDKVRHKKHKYLATVETVSKSGKTVRIKPEAMRYKTGNVPVECLTIIKEESTI